LIPLGVSIVVAKDNKRASSYTSDGGDDIVRLIEADRDKVWMVEGTPVVVEEVKVSQ